jgi:hypothetical protein
VPRRADYTTELDAMAIVRAEEVERGWTPGPTLSKAREKLEGCDFLSSPPDGGEPPPVEVKGWGESMFNGSGAFRYSQDINVEQLGRAQRDPNWRLEIVANLTAAREGGGQVERLTVRAHDLAKRVKPWKYRVDLTDFADQVREVAPPPAAPAPPV